MKLFSRLFACSLTPSRALVVLVLGASIATGCIKSTSGPESTFRAESTAPVPSSWPELARRWWQAATEAASSTEPALPPRIDEREPSPAEIERLAQQHPAWKMAQALESSTATALQFQEIRSSASQRLDSLTAPSFDISFSELAKAVPYISETISFLPLPVGEEIQLENYSLDTARLQQLHDEAREQQRRSLSEFLRMVQERQRSGRQEYREILEGALQEKVEVASRRVPENVALVLPDSEMQLEMTNLRLRLLNNLFTTPEERRVARERLTELLAQWRAALHEQELARAEQLRRLRLEEPAQIEAEGRVLLESTLERIREAQRQSREAAVAEHERLLEEEFGSSASRLVPVSPATPILQTALATGSEASERERERKIETDLATTRQNVGVRQLAELSFLRTDSSRLPSENLLPASLALSASAQGSSVQRIRELRQLARRDAIRQARMALRLKNTTLQD